MDWTQRIADLVGQHGTVARAVIVEVSGSTPRAVGDAMFVTAVGREGKIGRAAVESVAIAESRRLIARASSNRGDALWLRSLIELPTGPILDNASAGTIVVLVEAFTASECEVLADQRRRLVGDLMLLARPLDSGAAPVLLTAEATSVGAPWRDAASIFVLDPGRTLARVASVAGRVLLVERLAPRIMRFHVYGTGLAARALVNLLAGLPFEVIWLDNEPVHFPEVVPRGVETLACPDLGKSARATQSGSFHAVMTASHELDLEVCRAVLEIGTFSFLGVIGSQIKRQRLIAQLARDGIVDAQLARLVCPIGLPSIRGKSPEVIAVSVAAQALVLQETLRPRGKKKGQDGAIPGQPVSAGSKR